MLAGISVCKQNASCNASVKSCQTQKLIRQSSTGVPNMPEELITKCTEGTDPISGLPACLPMEGQTWYVLIHSLRHSGLKTATP